ncbi:MAG: hemerythrin domain-containing protein [Actinomycetota bacterium]|nr:hemerythrin domain-containing protein [Actinomycetota bacterium]HSH23838.1 hemerythrin domain-containing protein [Acidimicrobiales bacterium]
MSDITKVLLDDHARVKRLFLRTAQGTEDYEAALDVCDELVIHATIEEELVYPALREVNPHAADESEEEHEEVKELIAEIQDLDPDDPALRSMVLQLKRAFMRHVEKEEEVVFPQIDQAFPDQLLEMGSQAFAMRQELLAERQPRLDKMKSLTANTGWGANRRRRSASGNMGF